MKEPASRPPTADPSHETESIYRQAISAAMAVPYRKDLAGRRYTFMGDGILRLTGYTSTEMTPDLWESLIRERIMRGEGAGLDDQQAIRLADDGKLLYWRCDARITTRSGAERWINDSAVQVLGPDGHSTGSVGMLVDITERKRLEETLTALVSVAVSGSGEEFFRTVVRRVALLFGVKGAFIAEVVPGETPQLQTLAFWVGDGFAANVRQALQDTPSARVIDLCRHVHVRDARARFPTDPLLARLAMDSFAGFPLVDTRGQPLGLLAILHDQPLSLSAAERDTMSLFAARVGAELEGVRVAAALELERGRFESLFENTPIAIWEEDLSLLHAWLEDLRRQGVSDLGAHLNARPDLVRHAWGLIRVLGVNRAAVEMNAAKDKQQLMTSLDHVFTDETRIAFIQELEAFWRGETVVEFLSNGRRCDGQPLDVLVRTQVFTRGGQPDFSRAVVTGIDITERRRSEVVLERQRRVLLELACSQAIAAGDWPQALKEITEAGARGADVARVGAWFLNEDGTELTCADRFDAASGHHTAGESLRAEEYPAYFQACATQRIIAAADARRHPQTSEFARGYFTEQGIVSTLDAPVRSAGRLVGVICMEHTGSCRSWLREEEAFGASLADVAALALQARERRRAEEQSRHLNAELEARVAARTRETRRQAFAMDSVVEGMAIQEGSCFVYLNRAYAEMFGYAIGELLGKPWQSLFDDAERQRIESVARPLLQRDRRWHGETTGRRKDGTTIDLEVDLTMMESNSVVCVCRDVTERRRAEAALRETARRLDLATRSGAIGIWEYDHETDRLWCDERVRQFYGLRPDEGTSLDDIRRRIHPDDLRRLEWELREALRTQKPIETEIRIIRPDGQERSLKGSAIILSGDDGRPQRAIGVHYDVTPMRRTEQALRESRDQLDRANEALRHASQMKNEFLASMSHELRTPLTSILGLSETLESGIHGPVTEAQGRALHTIGESGRHLLELINGVLDIATIETGQVVLRRQTSRIEELCRSSLRLVENLARQRNQRVRYSVEPVDLHMDVDPLRLRQILVNLMSNAVKFTPPGGEWGLEVHAEKTEARVVFCVWDKGIGIAPQDLERLFEPFTQLDSSLARQYPGTGLGLTLVHRMVALHGGTVHVESQPDAGSRFIVRLPWVASQTMTAATEAEPAPPPRPANDPCRSLLIVEDNEENADLIADYLEAFGYHTVRARSGAEALDVITSSPPALVLMDIQMPGMDGLEAIRQMRAATDPHVARIPILALTALAMTGDRERCLAAGANQYLAKPYRLNRLLAEVEALLGRVSTSDPPS